MCARYVIAKATSQLLAQMELVDPDGNPFEVDERYDVRPTVPVPAIVETVSNGKRQRLGVMPRWSLTPPFSPTLKTPYATFNARSESVADKPTFRNALRQRTVLVADGYYEWVTEADGVKRPFFIHGEKPLLIAGLFSWWKDPTLAEDHPLRWTLTATMLTREAHGDLAKIHDRTPVFVAPAQLTHWLDSEVADAKSLIAHTAEASGNLSTELNAYEVSALRGNAGEHWLDPVETTPQPTVAKVQKTPQEPALFDF